MSRQILILVVLLVFLPVQGLAGTDSCSRTSAMEVYSNAFIHPETEDVLGYELALKRHNDSTVEALLYIYEGAPNDDAVPLHGHISGKKLSVQGEWTLHLVEYPSKRKIVETRFVKVDGVLNSASFKGKVNIEDMTESESVRLKHVKGLLLCRK